MRIRLGAIHRVLAVACALLASLGHSSAAVAAAAAPASVAACDGPFQAMLQKAPQRFDARALWLDAHRISWPGAQLTVDGRFKLYHAAGATISAAVGATVSGDDGTVPFTVAAAHIDLPQFRYTGGGAQFVVDAGDEQLRALQRGQLLLVQENSAGVVLAATRLQAAGALDRLYAGAVDVPDLGVTVTASGARFALWAPTAQQVAVCIYDSGNSGARMLSRMQRDDATGVWRASVAGDVDGGYYTFLVDVIVDPVAGDSGLVRNLVTDPYSVSLTTDSARSYIANLASPRLAPPGWDTAAAPPTVRRLTDMAVYELHVRDFSINDASVPAAHRGKYSAFGDTGSNGMRHLAALAKAGLTDIHLLPIYDFASVPEQACTSPTLTRSGSASQAQQTLVMASADTDCFNWGYDPLHYSAPEGSYASDAGNGRQRVIELRAMVASLHRLGLRVGMDVVYNHTYRSGQHPRSVLDRIVPGYYHRLDGAGAVAQSTCCDNTATEHAMMGKLMIDSVVMWASAYRIDSFRFDLMGHQPRAVMEQLQERVNAAVGHPVELLGEGWNFGEVENGARFVQASQLSLGGSGIGSFSDRARDAMRGGSAADSGALLISEQGFINGLVTAPNALAGARPLASLQRAADLVKVGLAGSLRDYRLRTADGTVKRLADIDYHGQSAGYAVDPGEAVNYVENHDNQTLYDINAFKLPRATSSAERARVQMLGAAIVAFSQGVAYYHAGIDTLRSKSLDRNSFNSGDWFNRIDWTYQTNYFGSGAPPLADNGKDYALIKPLLMDARLRPTARDIGFARDVFRELLAVRASSTLFRLRSAADVLERLHFLDSPAPLIAARIDGEGYAGAGFKTVAYFVNVDRVARTVVASSEQGRRYRLHPAHRADRRVRQARFDRASGRFVIPARTAVVFVE
ncbi:alpha-1,6-glucosidase domain-containing protein [Massilia sp. PWRC2]|uniref:alpha-1,6-glucosidase domain-containing protein n=1 Tax=Massilia sp. PWRC2 TaxID=2804626 RepID=UPI003CEE5309